MSTYGLDYSGGVLVVIDGAKALASAVRSVFGDYALVQRCQHSTSLYAIASP